MFYWVLNTFCVMDGFNRISDTIVTVKKVLSALIKLF